MNVELFGKFACLSNVIRQEADALNSCCNPVIAAELTNGDVVFIGVDAVDDGGGGYELKQSIGTSVVLASILSGTSSEEARLEVTATAGQRKVGFQASGITLDDLVAL